MAVLCSTGLRITVEIIVGAHDFSLFKLNSVEPDTVLFTFDDLDVPIGYLRYVEGIRPDVDVLNDQGLVFGNRLYSPLISENDKKKDYS